MHIKDRAPEKKKVVNSLYKHAVSVFVSVCVCSCCTHVAGTFLFRDFTSLSRLAVINFSVSVENPNIVEQGSSRRNLEAQSGKSDSCDVTQIFNMSELLHYTALRSGRWKCPSVGYVKCPGMSELK